MQRTKIESLLGFAVKAGKVIFGYDTIERSKKKLYVMIVSATISENTENKVLKLAQSKNVKVIRSEKELSCAVGRENCKAIALTDRQMSDAILGMLDDNYRLIGTEVK